MSPYFISWLSVLLSPQRVEQDLEIASFIFTTYHKNKGDKMRRQCLSVAVVRNDPCICLYPEYLVYSSVFYPKSVPRLWQSETSRLPIL